MIVHGLFLRAEMTVFSETDTVKVIRGIKRIRIVDF